jgi:hypothetical protein
VWLFWRLPHHVIEVPKWSFILSVDGCNARYDVVSPLRFGETMSHGEEEEKHKS